MRNTLPPNSQLLKLELSEIISQNLSGGVRYITEELISKIAKEEDLTQITHLTLTLVPREGGKKIRYIENLGKLRRLVVLDLR